MDELLITDEIENPTIHLEKMLESALDFIDDIHLHGRTPDNRMILRTFNLINSLCLEYELDGLSMNEVGLRSDSSSLVSILEERLNTSLTIDTKNEYVHLFRKTKNSMSDKDYEYIQTLINDLKSKIKEATNFDKDLQRRVLDKINKLQSELDKDISKLESTTGALLTVAYTLGNVYKEVLRPMINDTLKIINEMKGIEAKENGEVTSNNILKYNNVEDVEVLKRNTIEE